MDVKAEMVELKAMMGELLELARAQQSELKKLRIALTPKRPKPTYAVLKTPMYSYEYGEVSTTVSARDWARIKRGEALSLRGQGSRAGDPMDESDDDMTWDYWQFSGGLDGRLVVTMKYQDTINEWEWDQAFVGMLSEVDIKEFPIAKKLKLTAK